MLQEMLTNPGYWDIALKLCCVLGAAGGWFVTGMLNKAGLEPSYD